MMPSFARGWEKDGWEAVYDGADYVRKTVGLLNSELHFDVCMDGDLDITEEDDEYGDESTVTIPCGDPLTAKKRAETLMEGL